MMSFKSVVAMRTIVVLAALGSLLALAPGVVLAATGADVPAVVRGDDWLLRKARSSGHATNSFEYGPGGQAVFGDWNGDGRATPGWFKDGVWYLRNSNSAGPPDRTLRYGSRGDIPVVGDWDGDPNLTTDLGVVRRSPKGWRWFLNRDYTDNGTMASDGKADAVFNYGSLSDVPVTGAWTKDDCAECVPVHRPAVVRSTSQGLRWLFETQTNEAGTMPTSDGKADFDVYFGSPGDSPVIGDWNDDSIDDVGVVRGNRWLLEGQSTDTSTGRRTASDGAHARAFRYGSQSDDLFLVWQHPYQKSPPPAGPPPSK